MSTHPEPPPPDRADLDGRELGDRPILRVSRQAGEGRLAAVFWLAVLAWTIFAGFEWVPKRYRVAQFEDAITDAAERASREKAANLKKGLLYVAGELDLPVTDKTLNFEAGGSSVRIYTEYVIPVDLPFYSYDWVVKHDVKRRLFRGF